MACDVGGGGMKAKVVLQGALLAALGIARAAAAPADNAPAALPPQELAAKIHYCTTCHGISGQGFRGYYPIPRLA